MPAGASRRWPRMMDPVAGRLPESRPAGKISVLIVDDHAILRAALRAALADERDLEVVGEASNGATALAEIRARRPAIVLLDLSMPGMGGIELIERIREEHLASRVIALTFHQGFTYAQAVIAAGGSGYVVKDAELPVLLTAIRAVHQGHTFIQLGQPEGAADQVCGTPGGRAPLSPREQKVLCLIAYGHTSREIAEQLRLSIKTIETHRHRLCQKLGLHTRADLVRFSLERGWLVRDGAHPESA